ncbi:hypothetical protein G6F57_016931 [Rhizopus arrhizus]|nr:hypothetical protein G6F57_016931 [Rhizopus arrhizus]
MARIGAPCRIGAVARIDHRQHALGEEIAVMRGAAIADVITVVTRIGARRVAGRVVPRAALLRGQAFLRRQPDQDEILQVDALLPQHVAHAAHQREAVQRVCHVQHRVVLLRMCGVVGRQRHPDRIIAADRIVHAQRFGIRQHHARRSGGRAFLRFTLRCRRCHRHRTTTHGQAGRHTPSTHTLHPHAPVAVGAPDGAAAASLHGAQRGASAVRARPAAVPGTACAAPAMRPDDRSWRGFPPAGAGTSPAATARAAPAALPAARQRLPAPAARCWPGTRAAAHASLPAAAWLHPPASFPGSTTGWGRARCSC